MTSPVIVGSVGVEVSASAKGFARRLRQAVVAEFKSAGLDKALADALGSRKIKVPVEPVLDTRTGLGDDFTAPLRRRVRPVEVPTEPGSRAAYEARLRAMVDSVSRTVRASIPVDVDRNRFQRSAAAAAAHLPQSFGSALQRVRDAANTAAATVGQAMAVAATAIFSMVNPATLAAVAIGGTVLAMVAVGPVAAAAAAAIGVLAGALASLPAFAVGGIATFGAFALALRGIGEAFKDAGKAAGGGGQSLAAQGRAIAAAQRSIAQAERGLASAERNYRNALRESLRAQQAVNEARRQAARRIEDLGRAVRGAALDERDAALRVREAERALAEAARSGDPLLLERAQLELEQAQYAAEQTAIAARDAAAAKLEADRKGVEGSDEVTAALDRQRQANEQVIAAADGLKSAQESLVAANESLAAAQEKTGASAGGLGKQLTKLAPAAQRFVDQIKAMKPAFERLRLDVQQKLFAGLDKTVRQVGDAWLPQLRRTLGDYATTFNQFFKDLGKSVTKPQFIDDIAAAAETGRRMVERIGKSISGPLTDAFGRLSRAAKPFMDAFGDEVAKLFEEFSAWIKSADESGKLEGFFKRTAGYLRDFFQAGKLVGSILGSLTAILFGADDVGSSGFMESLQRLADFLKDPKNRRTLSAYVATFKEFGRVFLTEILPAALKFGMWLIGTGERIARFIDQVKRFRDNVVGFADSVVSTIGGLPGRADEALSSLGDTIAGWITTATDRATSIVAGWLTRAQQQFTSLRTRVTTALNSLPGVLGGLLQTAVNRGVAVLGTIVSRGASAVSGLGGRIRATLSNLDNQLYDIGRNLVFGLWNGVTSLGSWLQNRIRTFAWNVVISFQNGFEVGSPSKLMADEVGRWLPPGIAAGMDSAIGSVEAARDRMIAAAIPDVASTYQLGLSAVADVSTTGTSLAAAPSAGSARVEFVGDAPGSFMRWVKENVRVLHGGDANAAFGRAPTAALAGR